MNEKYLIGVDVGTASIKAGVVSLSGALMGVESEPTNLISNGKGHMEQDPDEMLQSAVKMIRRVVERSAVNPGMILGMSFDGQMAGIMAIDRHYQPATPYDSWLDTRCTPYVEQMHERAGEEILTSTGCYPSTNHGPKMLWWKEEQPETFKNIFRFILPSAYVAGRLAGLTGEEAYMDTTYLHFSGFAKTDKGEWNTELIRLFSFPEEKLPHIISPTQKIGGLVREYANRAGLLEGTPIIAGCGDTIASMVGAGVVEPGQVFDVAGTASVLSICVDAFRPDKRSHTLMTSRSIFPGVYYAYAYINGGGMCLDWFRDHFMNQCDGLEDLNTQAEDVPPGSQGLFFLPHLAGRVCPGKPEYRGQWQGFDFSHRPKQFYRSILEGISYEYALYFNQVKGLYPDLKVKGIRGIGGGSRSPLWNQIKSNVLGLPYENLKTSECGVVGSAFTAGVGVGAISDPAKEIKRFVERDREWAPNPEQASVYKGLIPIYSEILERSEPLHKLIYNSTV